MKFFRVLAGGVLLLLAAIGAAVWYAAQHENQLVNLVLAQVAKRTGLQIEPSHTRLGLGTRLVVVLERPRVIIDHREAAQLQVIRAVFSYWALLHRTGLPLYGLTFNHGTISLPQQSEAWPVSGLTTDALDMLTHYLAILSGISRRFDLIDITLADGNHRPLVEHLNAIAYQPHYRDGPWPWIVRFNTQAGQPLIAGAHFAGNLQLGEGRDKPGLPVDGQLWFWKLPLRRVRLADFTVSVQMEGEVDLAVSANAQSAGNFTLTMRDLVVGGPALNQSLTLGSFSSRADYRLSQTRAELSNFELDHQQSPVLQARATVLNPYASNRTVTFVAGGIALALTNLAKWLRTLRAVPAPLLHAAERIRSGTLMVNRVALKTPESLENLNLQKLAKEFQIDAALTRFSYVPPPDLGLPPVYQFDAQMTYSGAVARIRQASAQIGGSSFSDIHLELDLLKAPNKISYRLKAAGWLDMGDVYGTARDFIERAQPKLRGELLWVHGHTSIQCQASDTVAGFRITIPPDYRVTADLGDVEFQLNKAPAVIWLKHGRVVLEPGSISLSQVTAVPMSETGNLVVNGRILPGTTPLQFRDFSVALHQLSSAEWVPLIIGPSETAVSGPVSGTLAVMTKVGQALPAIVGKLTLDKGSVQPGFLRSPIVADHSATLTLDGTGLILDMPDARLEGQPLNFRMAVTDLNHPQVRIDAKVASLDFGVMRFIRLPWSPSSPPRFFPVPVSGHIEAQAGNFDKLAMSNISADFYHNSQTWRVDKFRATAFNGTIDLILAGRTRDDWLNMKGVIAHMDAGPLFLLSGAKREAPIVGKLSAAGDLWANTNTDFFRTLAGSISITMTDGVLNRFTLLKRILSLINLKNWLTAQFPNPLEAGLPFNTLAADFRANKGDFYTDNLRMNGPVMDITARGDIDIGNSTMNMEIVLLALQTVNWLLNNIPIIGKHLGGATKHLVGAYFQVKGPISNPTVWPKPLTSVAEFVLKTLSLPINIIVPDTIQ